MNSACNRWWNILVWLYISISCSTCFGASRWRDWEMQKSCQTGVGNFYYLKEMKGKRWAALLGNHFSIPLWKSRWRKPKHLKRNLKKTTEAEAFFGNCKEAAAQVKLNSWDPWNSWYDRHAEMHSPWRGLWRVSRTDPNSINNMWRQPWWGKVGAHTDRSWSNHKKSLSQETPRVGDRERERERTLQMPLPHERFFATCWNEKQCKCQGNKWKASRRYQTIIFYRTPLPTLPQSLQVKDWHPDRGTWCERDVDGGFNKIWHTHTYT